MSVKLMPRQPGLVKLDDEFAKRFGAEYEKQDFSIDIEQLRSVEMAVGYRFHTDVLAAFAAEWTVESYVFRLNDVIAGMGWLNERGFRGDYIAVARCPNNGLLAVLMDSSPQDTPSMLWSCSEKGDVRKWGTIIERMDKYGPPAQLKLTKPHQVSGSKAVFHRKYGKGRIVVDRGSGPLRMITVQFETNGLRKIRADFLKEVGD